MKNDKPSIIVIDMYDDEDFNVNAYISSDNYIPSEDYFKESDFILSNEPLRLRFQVNVPKLIMAFMTLPPIEYFYGRTPLKEWISRCKPFEPKGLGRSVIMVELTGNQLSERYKLYLKALEHDMEDLRNKMNEYFRIKPDEI